MPAISVIIPTYNRADLITGTLESVREQTFTDWECIIVDDGSTDGTEEVVQRFVERDERFRYVGQANAGVCVARNRGISLARGKYIAFLDSDDHFAPDKLEWQAEALEGDADAVLVYGDTLQCDPQDMRRGRIYLGDIVDKPSGWAFESLLQCSSIYAPLVRAEAIRGAGGFDSEMIPGEDWDMWIRLARVGRFLFEPRVHLFYRLHAGSVSQDTLQLLAGARRVVEKNLRSVPFPKRLRLRRAARAYLRSGYTPRLLADADRCREAGDWETERRAWLALASLDPAMLRRRMTLLTVIWARISPERPPVWRSLLARLRSLRPELPG
jgi:glycosyltransferase involved in cell wall biosynthesis